MYILIDLREGKPFVSRLIFHPWVIPNTVLRITDPQLGRIYTEMGATYSIKKSASGDPEGKRINQKSTLDLCHGMDTIEL